MTDPLGGQSAATGTGQSAGTGDQGTSTATDTSGQSAATGTTATTPPADGQSAVSREEFDRLRAQLAAADKARAEAQAAHAQLRDKDMPEMQKLQRDFQEAAAKVEALTTANQSLRVENAFIMTAPGEYDWYNPSAALQLLDRSKITVDADGNVQGMKDALKALALAHPYLLKPKASDDQGSQGNPPPPGTSPATGGIARPAGTQPDVAAMTSRFPALKQRLG